MAIFEKMIIIKGLSHPSISYATDKYVHYILIHLIRGLYSHSHQGFSQGTFHFDSFIMI